MGFKTGICWWHSRFQRNAAYLVQFNPSAPKPTKAEAKEIAKRIIDGKSVVIIPGYSELRLFTVHYTDELLSVIKGWMAKDTFLSMRWTNGLKGEASLPVQEMQNHLHELQKSFHEADGLLFLTLQVKGIAAHSWLLTSIEQTTEGWNISIIDSLDPLHTYDLFLDHEATSMIPLYKYKQNQAYHSATRMIFKDKNAVGYESFKDELTKIQTTQKDYCL